MMVAVHPDYVIDENQKRKSVILPFEERLMILDVLARDPASGPKATRQN